MPRFRNYDKCQRLLTTIFERHRLMHIFSAVDQTESFVNVLMSTANYCCAFGVPHKSEPFYSPNNVLRSPDCASTLIPFRPKCMFTLILDRLWLLNIRYLNFVLAYETFYGSIYGTIPRDGLHLLALIQDQEIGPILFHLDYVFRRDNSLNILFTSFDPNSNHHILIRGK